MNKTLCDPLKTAIKNDDIEQVGNEYQIYGHPQSANEGDGYIMDMTERLTITHCPFCGSKLPPYTIDWHRKKAMQS